MGGSAEIVTLRLRSPFDKLRLATLRRTESHIDNHSSAQVNARKETNETH